MTTATNTATKPTTDEAVAFFARLGYKQVHEWTESHGNGGTVSMQSGEWDFFNRVEGIDISYGCDGNVKFVRSQSKDNYLLAEHIKENTTEFRQIGKESISACGTAGHSYHLHLSLSHLSESHGDLMVIYQIEDVVGHGAKAHRVETKYISPKLHAAAVVIYKNWKATRGW